MRNDCWLRSALGANALFSAASGGILVMAPASVGTWIGFDGDSLLRFVGGGLLVYAAFLVYLAAFARRPAPLSVAASLADMAWVAATIVVAAFAPSAFSLQGWFIVGGVACAVLAFGLAQAAGIARLLQHPDATLRTDRDVRAIIAETVDAASARGAGDAIRSAKIRNSLPRSSADEHSPND